MRAAPYRTGGRGGPPPAAAAPVPGDAAGRARYAEPVQRPSPDAEWIREFEAAARRPLRQRWRYAFIHTYKPVLDDARFRAFDTMAEYRRWCEEHLPSWLGYGR